MTTPLHLVPLDGQTPQIAPTAWIAPNATVIGAVEIAEHASVFYGAVLRADQERITVGAGTNLQDLVAVHADPGFPAVIGSGVSIGHGAILHGCTIEDDCLIGMGSIVLNGAVVGKGTLVAAGALVVGGTIIPPGSLVVGNPGKVRRELSPDEVQANRDNATHYVELAQRHRRTWTTPLLE